MNEKSLEKNLANMERELLALQTAHNVGIGAVDYYKYTMKGTPQNMGSYYRIFFLIKVKDGELLYPFMEGWEQTDKTLGNEGTLLGYTVYKNNTGDKFMVPALDWNPDEVKFVMISTSQLEWTYTYDEEVAKDWIDWED